MSDLLVLNFDLLTTPTLTLSLQPTAGGNLSKSWGIAWYPNDDKSAIVVKDPATTDNKIITDDLADKGNFCSTTFFCKVKDGTEGHMHNVTQPFVRSYAGSDWIFSLTGTLDKNQFHTLQESISHSLEPLGSSGAELAFCYFMSKIQINGARKLSDIKPTILQQWLSTLDKLGEIDMVITDGNSLICYHGENSLKNLSYLRLLPPREQLNYSSLEATLTFDDPRDKHHTALFFSTSALINDDWQALQPKQMVIAQRGNIVWDSHDQNHNINSSAFTSQTMLMSHSTVQMEQAQQSIVSQGPTLAGRNQPIITNPRAMTQSSEGGELAYRLLEITHRTTYSYSGLIEHSAHIFRLQPVEDSIQEVVQSTLSLSVQGEEIQYDDVFGNRALHYTINSPYQQLVIENNSIIKIYGCAHDDYSLSRRRSSIPLVWMPWQRQMMMAYLLPEELPETQLVELTEYAMSFVERNDYHLLKTLLDINQTIFKDYTYVQDSTSIHSTAFDCYTSRKGVCQDFTNLLICLARLLGVPARYRMGYIYTGANYENKAQSEASHAWVEVYLPYVGWRGIDPTNGCIAGQDHIRVACGRNYRDSTPTSGTIFKGNGEQETLTVDVEIVAS